MGWSGDTAQAVGEPPEGGALLFVEDPVDVDGRPLHHGRAVFNLPGPEPRLTEIPVVGKIEIIVSLEPTFQKKIDEPVAFHDFIGVQKQHPVAVPGQMGQSDPAREIVPEPGSEHLGDRVVVVELNGLG